MFGDQNPQMTRIDLDGTYANLYNMQVRIEDAGEPHEL